jgi:hypothetical protein
MRKEEFLCVGCDFKWRVATFWSGREAARSSSNKREWKLEWVLESTRQRQKFTVDSRSSQIEDNSRKRSRMMFLQSFSFV